MTQLNYNDNLDNGPYAGAPVDMGCSGRTISRKLGGAVAQRYTVTVDTANAGTDTITFVIDGTTYAVAYTGVAADKPATVDAAIAAIKANSSVNARVLASEDPSNTDKLFLDARLAGDGFTATVSADLSIAATTANVETANLGFGLCTVAATGGKAKLVGSSDFTAKVVGLTPTAENDATYKMTIALKEGDRVTSLHTFQFTADSLATVAEITAGLAAATPDIALPANTVTVADGTTLVTITGDLPGIDFEVTGSVIGAAAADPTATVTVATTTTRAVPTILGISRHAHVEQDASGLVYYADPMAAAIAEGGAEFWVELDSGQDPAEGDPVYCRLTASASEQAGAFRTSKDANDCFLLESVAPGRFRWGAGGAKTGLDGKLIGPMRLAN